MRILLDSGVWSTGACSIWSLGVIEPLREMQDKRSQYIQAVTAAHTDEHHPSMNLYSLNSLCDKGQGIQYFDEPSQPVLSDLLTNDTVLPYDIP